MVFNAPFDRGDLAMRSIHLRRSVAPFLLVALAPSVACAQGAPRGLYGKSVILSWVNSVSEVGPDGERRTPQIQARRVAYVSSAGRLFVRASRSNVASGRTRQSDIAPGDTQN